MRVKGAQKKCKARRGTTERNCEERGSLAVVSKEVRVPQGGEAKSSLSKTLWNKGENGQGTAEALLATRVGGALASATVLHGICGMGEIGWKSFKR